LEVVWSPQLIS